MDRIPVGARFSTPVQTDPGVKNGQGVTDPSPPSSAVVKNG